MAKPQLYLFSLSGLSGLTLKNKPCRGFALKLPFAPKVLGLHRKSELIKMQGFGWVAKINFLFIL